MFDMHIYTKRKKEMKEILKRERKRMNETHIIEIFNEA